METEPSELLASVEELNKIERALVVEEKRMKKEKKEDRRRKRGMRGLRGKKGPTGPEPPPVVVDQFEPYLPACDRLHSRENRRPQRHYRTVAGATGNEVRAKNP